MNSDDTVTSIGRSRSATRQSRAIALLYRTQAMVNSGSVLKAVAYLLLFLPFLLVSTNAHSAPPLADGKYMLESEANGQRFCLIFGNNGNAAYPSRHNWGGGDYCGIPGGKASLLDNKQAIFHLTNIDGGELYTIESAANGSKKCLLFLNNGHAPSPARHSWGGGSYCGFPGGKNGLLDNRQAVWRVKSVGSGKFTIESTADGQQKCLIFSNNGNDPYPTRHNWGQGADFCGMPGGKDSLIANRQAIWIPTPVAASVAQVAPVISTTSQVSPENEPAPPLPMKLPGITLTGAANLILQDHYAAEPRDTPRSANVQFPVVAQSGLVSYTARGGFDCCGSDYGAANLNDGDVGTISDGLHAIARASTGGNPPVVMDFGNDVSISGVAIYNGYVDRDDGDYTLKTADGTVLGSWRISGTGGTGGSGVDSFWLAFKTEIITSQLTIDSANAERGTMSFREIQVLRGAAPGITLTGAANLLLHGHYATGPRDTPRSANVQFPVVAQSGLVSYTATGRFDCCGPNYGVANLNDGDVGTTSDGLYAIPSAGRNAVVMDFGNDVSISGVAIYNGYGNRDDGDYTLKTADGTVLGSWRISGTGGTGGSGVDSFWLAFKTEIITSQLIIDSTENENDTMSFREIQVLRGEWTEPTSAYVVCANQGEICRMPHRTGSVYFGVDTRWKVKTASYGKFFCDSKFFGDPAPGIQKKCYAPKTHFNIGDEGPNGGIVFHTSDSGRKGFEAARADSPYKPTKPPLNNAAIGHIGRWSNNSCRAGTGDTGTLEGFEMASTIIKKCGDITAANSASAAGPGWYLPRRDQLKLMYKYRNEIGGFTAREYESAVYWSSGENRHDSRMAYVTDFDFGEHFFSIKESKFRVRAVHDFDTVITESMHFTSPGNQ